MEAILFYMLMPQSIYHFKAKGSEINPYPLCSGNISKDFAVSTMKETGLNGYVQDFSVDYNTVNVSDFIDFYKHSGSVEPTFMWCGINASLASKRRAKQVNEGSE